MVDLSFRTTTADTGISKVASAIESVAARLKATFAEKRIRSVFDKTFDANRDKYDKIRDKLHLDLPPVGKSTGVLKRWRVQRLVSGKTVGVRLDFYPGLNKIHRDDTAVSIVNGYPWKRRAGDRRPTFGQIFSWVTSGVVGGKTILPVSSKLLIFLRGESEDTLEVLRKVKQGRNKPNDAIPRAFRSMRQVSNAHMREFAAELVNSFKK